MTTLHQLMRAWESGHQVAQLHAIMYVQTSCVHARLCYGMIVFFTAVSPVTAGRQHGVSFPGALQMSHGPASDSKLLHLKTCVLHSGLRKPALLSGFWTSVAKLSYRARKYKYIYIYICYISGSNVDVNEQEDKVL